MFMLAYSPTDRTIFLASLAMAASAPATASCRGHDARPRCLACKFSQLFHSTHYIVLKNIPLAAQLRRIHGPEPVSNVFFSKKNITIYGIAYSFFATKNFVCV